VANLFVPYFPHLLNDDNISSKGFLWLKAKSENKPFIIDS
jgi:hypothetical protein